MRSFNTAGPCDHRWHYMLPAAERLPEAPQFVQRGAYFSVHAPRQTGKTTTLQALARALTAEGKYAALLFSCETGGAADDDYAAAQRAVLTAIHLAAAADLPAELRPPDPWPERDELSLLSTALTAWALACPRPLVLLFDEIDALRGQSLRSVLSQLRAGYHRRPTSAPWSVVLCGLRDVREYKLASGGLEPGAGSKSPFNIKLESVRLGDFDPSELRALYAQHSAATGQPFTEAALFRAFELTQGQPWMVNALAREVVEKVPVSGPIEPEHIEQAKERLILARATHLDSLAARLHEPRVRRLLEPIVAGGAPPAADAYHDDFAYVRDLGLVAQVPPVRPANPIYAEVIVRVLADSAQGAIVHDSRSFVLPDGTLCFDRVLQEFAAFWREHGDVLAGGLSYHEVAPQLVLMAFLQRVVNGGGLVDREYGAGRGRIDLHVRWPHMDPDGRRVWQREAIELEVRAEGRADPLTQGLAQLDEYLGRLGLGHGTLVIFDRRSDAPPLTERVAFETASTASGRLIGHSSSAHRTAHRTFKPRNPRPLIGHSLIGHSLIGHSLSS